MRTDRDHWQRTRRILLISACFLLLTVPSAFAQPNLDDLRNRITNGSVEDKRDALFEIRNLRTAEASRIAIPALNDLNELVRATAPSSLVFLPKPEAANLIIPLLKDKAAFVRSEAAYALGEAGDDLAARPLIQTMQKDSSDPARSAAAAALGKIGDVFAADALSAILQKKPRGTDENLRRSAARSIGQIAQIIRTGKKRVETPQNFLPEKYKDKKPDAEPVTNSFLSFRNAVPILISVLLNRKEVDDVRREAAFALGAIGDISARPALSGYLSSPDNYLAEICREALLKLDEPN